MRPAHVLRPRQPSTPFPGRPSASTPPGSDWTQSPDSIRWLHARGSALFPSATLAACHISRRRCPERTRWRQTGDESGTDRIDTVGHDNRDGRGRLHGRNRIWICPGDDLVHAEPDQFRGKRGQPFHLAVGEAVLDDDILANAVAEAPQALLERVTEME